MSKAGAPRSPYWRKPVAGRAGGSAGWPDSAIRLPNFPTRSSYVAQAIRLPPGYQLRTDGHGGGPGDGLYLLFVLVVLVLPASVIVLSDLVVLIWAIVSRRYRACKAVLIAIALWALAIVFELR